MPDSHLEDLPEATEVGINDLFYMLTDPGGEDRKVQAQNLTLKRLVDGDESVTVDGTSHTIELTGANTDTGIVINDTTAMIVLSNNDGDQVFEMHSGSRVRLLGNNDPVTVSSAGDVTLQSSAGLLSITGQGGSGLFTDDVDLIVVHPVQITIQSPTIGFFDASPVPKQSITGATTQEQVDSLVAALVALGLVTDDR